MGRPYARTAPIVPPRAYHARMAAAEPLAPAPRWRRVAPFAAAALLLALVVGGGIAAFSLSRPATSDAPAQPPPFAAPPPASPVTRFDVREASGGALTLAPASHEGQPLTVALDPATAVEALLPLAPDAIAPGHWLTVLGEPDPVRNFVIRRIVALREPSAPAADGLARSPRASRARSWPPTRPGVRSSGGRSPPSRPTPTRARARSWPRWPRPTAP